MTSARTELEQVYKEEKGGLEEKDQKENSAKEKNLQEIIESRLN